MTHDSDFSPETDPVTGIVAWFGDHGYELELYRGRDGSHRAAFPITDKVRHFGLGETPLAAAQQAQAMLADRLRHEALQRPTTGSRPSGDVVSRVRSP